MVPCTAAQAWAYPTSQASLFAPAHTGSSLTSSTARTAETYPRMVDLACPILTRHAKNADSVSVSDDCSALIPSKPAKVDNADRYLIWVLGAHPRTPTAATRYEPSAAIAMAQQAATARKVGPGAWEGTGAWFPATDRESEHQQGHPHPVRLQRPQARQDQWGHWKCQCLNCSCGTFSRAHI